MIFKVEKDWTTAAGLRAVILWMGDLGHFNGYVAVGEGHSLYGADYNKPSPALREPPDGTKVGKRGIIDIFCAAGDPEQLLAPTIVFDVHGGLTYSGGSGRYPIEAEGLHWFGFDCGHSGDALRTDSAGFANRWGSFNEGEFRDAAYVEAECESLARQIASYVYNTKEEKVS